jgi:8-oxo-dGTP diphosphatase
MREIDVGCAIIEKEGRLLIAQRGPGSSMAGFWEFPGGKREDKETMEDCLVREVHEELCVRIRPNRFLCLKEDLRGEKKLRLHFYLCAWVSGDPVCRDCFAYRWVGPEELKNFRFPPADETVIDELVARGKVHFAGSDGSSYKE